MFPHFSRCYGEEKPRQFFQKSGFTPDGKNDFVSQNFYPASPGPGAIPYEMGRKIK
jgi:hypothetical protein